VWNAARVPLKAVSVYPSGVGIFLVVPSGRCIATPPSNCSNSSMGLVYLMGNYGSCTIFVFIV
jgi:hypothetical protein